MIPPRYFRTLFGCGTLFGFGTLLGACREPKSDDTTDTSPPEETPFAYAGIDQYIPLGESIHLDSSESSGTTFEWNMDDGTVLSGTEVDHTFSEIGRYRVVLTASNEIGERSTDTLNVVVYPPFANGLPQSQHTMVITEEAVWTVLPESNAVHILPLDSTQPVQSFEICLSPTSIASDQRGHWAVTCSASGAIALFETTNTAAPPSIPIQKIELSLHSSPTAILPPQPNRSGSTDSLWYVVDSANHRLGSFSWSPSEPAESLHTDAISWLDVGQDLRGLARHPDGTIFLPRWRSAEVGGEIYLVNPQDNSIDILELAVDYSGDSDNTTGGLPNLLESVYPSLDGSTVYAPFSHANILRGLYRSNEMLTHENSLRGILGRIDWEQQTETPTERKHFDEKGRANALAFSPYGDITYLLHSGVAQINILDGFSNQILGSISDVGIQPSDIQVVGEFLYVYSWLTREIIAYDIQDPMRPTESWRRSFVESEPLDATILWGKQLFHNAADTRMTRTGYISCAHCHPNGDHDGQTWDFTDRGEGLRNTTSLLGRSGTAMGRLHWTGNFDEIQDFEGDMRLHFGGSGFLSEEDWALTADPLGESKVGLSNELDAIAAYVSSLSTTPPSPYVQTSNEWEVGSTLFTSLGCADCHGGDSFTDSSLTNPIRHDVGTLTAASGQRLGETLDGLDTPTLLGLWSSAPYLHDGSAATIEDAILAHTGYENMDTVTLNQLTLFLLSL